MTLHRPQLAPTMAMVIAAAGIASLVACETGESRASPSPVRTSSAVTAPPTAAQNSQATSIPLPTTVTLSAPGPNVVWALVAGSVLFRSTNRGDTWEHRQLPPRAINIEASFVSDAEGWVTSFGPPATQCQLQKVTVWHTVDAGASWQEVNVSGIADSGCKQGLAFVNPDRGFLGVWDPNHAPVIYYTSDEGRTWLQSALPDPPGLATQPGGRSLHAGVVHAFGSTLLTAAGEYVYRSTDGGMTWTYLATLPNLAGSVAFVSASRWLQIVPGQSTESTNAGATWYLYASDYSQAAPIAPSVVFADERVGYATVRGGIKRTVDGGHHWTSLRTLGST